MSRTVPDLNWSLYYKVDEVRLDDVRTDQVRAILCGLREEVLPYWMVWEEGTETWRPARFVLPNLRGLEIARPWAETVPAGAPSGAFDPNSGLHEIDPVTEAGPIKQRVSPRYNQTLEVVLDLDGKLLRNRTVNISMGGMLLEAPIPSGPRGPFNLIVRKDGDELHMRCRLIATRGEAAGTRLFIDHCNKLSVLRRWILEK